MGVRAEALASRPHTPVTPTIRPRARRARPAVVRRSTRGEWLDTSKDTAQLRQTDAAEAESGDSACPYTAATSLVSSLRAKRPTDGQFPVYPGPGANVLRNVADVMYIGLKGIERATLYFADSYGPIARYDRRMMPVGPPRADAVVLAARPLSRTNHRVHTIGRSIRPIVVVSVLRRFPNPVGLGDAAGWVFLNNPELIEHCCRTNTANYTERFLPVRIASLRSANSLTEMVATRTRPNPSVPLPPYRTNLPEDP
jgi:hypothetical protein